MIIQPDISLAEDGGYYNMSGLTDAGRKFVAEHSSPTPDSRVRGHISIGAAAYAQVLEAAKAAGLVVVER
jgi:hypothetical protein